MPLILSLKKAAAAGISLRFIRVPFGDGLPLALRCWMLTADADGILGLSSVYSQGCMADEAAGTLFLSEPANARFSRWRIIFGGSRGSTPCVVGR